MLTPRDKTDGSSGTASMPVHDSCLGADNYADYDVENYLAHYEHHGYSHDDFRQRLKAGELLPITPWEQFESLWSLEKGTIFAQLASNLCYTEVTSNWYGPDTSHLRLDIEDARSYCAGFDTLQYTQQAASKIYTKNSHDTLTFLAEIGKVASMFARIRTTLWELLSRGDFSHTWMQARYGWRTLWYDLLSLTDTIIDMQREQRTRFSQKAGNSFVADFTEVEPWNVTAFSSNLEVKTKRVLSLRGHVVLDKRANHPFKFNPVVTGWEVIPFSFLVDKFLDVGQAIEALSMLGNTSDVTSSGGWSLITTRTVELIDVVPTAAYTAATDASFMTKSTSEYTLRKPQSIPIMPMPGVKLDGWGILDLVAIFSPFKEKYRGQKIPLW